LEINIVTKAVRV